MVWALPEDEAALLALAKGYPFEVPGYSYLYQDGNFRALEPADESHFVGRTAVIGHGSNRSPAQMRRKFSYLSGERSALPVCRAWIEDHDVVYSAHITQYGSVAANLQHSPGVTSEVVVNWLTDEQLERMHATELGGENYFYGKLEGIALRLEAGPQETMSEIAVYISTHGCLSREGAPIGLAAVAAEGRSTAALSQIETQHLVRERHRPDHQLDHLILKNIQDPAARRVLVEEMRQTAVPQAVPHFTTLVSP